MSEQCWEPTTSTHIILTPNIGRKIYDTPVESMMSHYCSNSAWQGVIRFQFCSLTVLNMLLTKFYKFFTVLNILLTNFSIKTFLFFALLGETSSLLVMQVTWKVVIMILILILSVQSLNLTRCSNWPTSHLRI